MPERACGRARLPPPRPGGPFRGPRYGVRRSRPAATASWGPVDGGRARRAGRAGGRSRLQEHPHRILLAMIDGPGVHGDDGVGELDHGARGLRCADPDVAIEVGQRPEMGVEDVRIQGAGRDAPWGALSEPVLAARGSERRSRRRMPGAGFEPACPFRRGILSPLCLPVSPPRRGCRGPLFWTTGPHPRGASRRARCRTWHGESSPPHPSSAPLDHDASRYRCRAGNAAARGLSWDARRPESPRRASPATQHDLPPPSPEWTLHPSPLRMPFPSEEAP